MFAKLKQVVVLLGVLALASCSSGKVDFIDDRGRGISWADYHGEWLVINYWAEWCAPCREEIPELNALHKADNDIRVLGVNYDAPAIDDLKRQIKAFAVAFPVIQADPEQQLAYLAPEALPTTYLFNPQGELAHKLIGPQTGESIEALTKGGKEGL